MSRLRLRILALGAIFCLQLSAFAVPVLARNDDRTGSSKVVVPLGTMAASRAAHTATTLPDGRVLLAGGFASGERSLATTELYDPAIYAFRLTGAMNAARSSHTATLLPDGKVLIAGGFDGSYLRSTEIYDPRTGSFTLSGEMITARSGHVAVVLQDGRVLIAGGVGDGWTFLRSAELYDPTSGTFSATGAMSVKRESHTATILSDGRVLVAGGHTGRRLDIEIYQSAELYDPMSGTFSSAGMMTLRRHKHDAITLVDGTVLITGGADERDEQGAYRSAEVYDPARNEFYAVAPMHATRYKHQGTSVLLSDGRVLVAGGARVVEVYDTATRTFCIVGASATRRFAASALLDGGRVLLTGGYGPSIAASDEAWLLDARLRCTNGG